MRHCFPSLAADFAAPRLVAAAGRVHSGPFLWVAPVGHVEFCHLDPDDGWLAVVSGRKRVRRGVAVWFRSLRARLTDRRLPQVELWPPTLGDEMAPNALGADGRTVQCAAPGPEPAAVFDLGAGDALFIPAFAWHRVTSPEESISLNFFFGDEAGYVAKVLGRPTFRLWLLNVLEQNAAGLPLILDHLDAAVSLFLKQQWADVATRGELDAIRAVVYDYLEAERPGAVAPGDRGARGRGGADAAPPPGARLKIRGLRNRGGVDFAEDRERGIGVS